VLSNTIGLNYGGTPVPNMSGIDAFCSGYLSINSNTVSGNSVEGVIVHSSAAPLGEFATSNPLLNRIHELVRWAQRSNMVSILTDCPHREKLGWIEQYHLNGPSIRYEFDVARIYTKGMWDMANAQTEEGLIPNIAPEFTEFKGAFRGAAEWGASFILVPWQQYEFDGDRNLFRMHYDAMKKYLAFFGSRATNYIESYGLGDWYDIGPRAAGVSQLTPIGLTATAFYFQDVEIMARVAALLGKDDDAKNYSELAEKIRAAFNEKFYDAANHSYGTGSQCANAIPLVMGICEPANRAAVLNTLVSDIREHDTANTAGDVGYRYVLRALADGGRNDVIFEMNNQSDKPGYGMQLKKGKTSLTEGWDGGHSQNHFMLGQIEEWFYHDLAGIQSGGNGFKQIIIAPHPVGDLTWAKASYNSIRGKIISDWKRDGEKFTLNISIPPNTTATVYVPAKSENAVKQASGAKYSRMGTGYAVFETTSGQYKFESEY